MVTAEAEKLDISDDEQKIIDQIEYYFSDINLRKDRFMKYQLRQNDGWFPLDKLMTFNKLKALSTDKSMIINSIKKANQNNLIELSECETKLRRIKPMPEFSAEYNKELNLRTLHLKGFPKDITFDELKNFCKNYGEIESIEMRKRDGNFKGCCMVVFKTKDIADKILEMNDLKYNDIELMKENKERYFERKKQYYESLRAKRKNKKNNKDGDDNNDGENKNENQTAIKTEGAIMKITDLPADTKYIQIKNELSKHSKVAFVTAMDETKKCMVRFQDKDGAKQALKALYDQRSDKKDATEEKPMEDAPAKTETPEDQNQNGKEEEKKKDSDDNKNDEKKDDQDSEYINGFTINLCGQNVNVSLVTGDEELNYWNEFNKTLQQQRQHPNRTKKNKWQKGKKRRFDRSDGDNKADANNKEQSDEPKRKMAKVE